jgi:uncharacterized membrane protein YtjA (UPF0391 family)
MTFFNFSERSEQFVGCICFSFKGRHKIRSCLKYQVTKEAPLLPIFQNSVNYNIMLRYALIFFVIAIIAGVLGFGGVAGSMAGIAEIFFYIFVVLLVVSVLMNLLKKA